MSGAMKDTMNGLYEIFPSAETGLFESRSDGASENRGEGESKNRGEGRFEVRLDPGHAVFAGHFPGNPVLPGICTLMIVRECASRMAGRALRFASIKESKFLAAITPEAIPVVRLRLAEDDDVGRALDATVCCNETTMLKLKARLTADE